MVFLIIGMFFVSAIVIGTFEDTFKQLNDRNIKKALLFKRSGATAAFTLLDMNNDQTISAEEFCDFVFRYDLITLITPITLTTLITQVSV